MIAPQQRTTTFPLGRTLATPGALRVIEASGESPADFLRRHANCDWGIVDQHDWEANNAALVNGGRLLSAYRTASGEKLWIITEADRSATTILRPDEY
jgi:hypothetical protein